MTTRNYDTNLLNLQSSIENNIEKWSIAPSSACNHIYSTLSKERESGDDIVIEPTVEEEDVEIEDQEELKEDELGSDLDVPGSELDDQQESVGSEDEENNYYSIGGDDHNDLEEDNGN